MQISIVIPVFNESEAVCDNLPAIFKTIRANKDYIFQFIIVDDGSTDDTTDKVLAMCEDSDDIELIAFSRNYGKEAAIYAGLEYASGEAAVVLDSDLLVNNTAS